MRNQYKGQPGKFYSQLDQGEAAEGAVEMELEVIGYRVTFSGPIGDSAPVQSFPLDSYDAAKEASKKWVQDADPTESQKKRGFVGAGRRSSVFGPDGLQMMFFRDNGKWIPEKRVHAGITKVGKGTLRLVFITTDAVREKKLKMDRAMEIASDEARMKKVRARPTKPRQKRENQDRLFEA